MSYADDAGTRIVEHNRNAVGGVDAKRNVGPVGHERVNAVKRRRDFISDDSDIERMGLPRNDETIHADAELGGQQPAAVLHVSLLIADVVATIESVVSRGGDADGRALGRERRDARGKTTFYRPD